MENIDISEDEYRFILTLPRFDLVMLLSDINDHGWPMARKTLWCMQSAAKARPKSFYGDSTRAVSG